MPSESPRTEAKITRTCEECGQLHRSWTEEERCAGEPLHPCSGCSQPLGGDPAEITLCADCILASMRPL